ncbi:MAG: DUF2358 domain-containing protein [Cyanobacteria bacterium P01_C01_bin.120]
MDIATVCDRIRQDYANFPERQSYELYAADVYFRDPLNEFTGVNQYREMIGFITRWFQQPQLDLHRLEQISDRSFKTEWTLSWIVPAPWRPSVAIPGWTEYQLNDAGQIVSHIDTWNCSRWQVLGQVFGLKSA